MDESLAPVTAGYADLASLIADVIGDIRLTALDPGMPAARRLHLIVALIEEAFGAPPATGTPAFIEPGMGPAAVTDVLAWLHGHPEPYTRAVELFAGDPPGSAAIKPDRDWQLRAAAGIERRRLSLPPGAQVACRDGWMITAGGVTAARTRIVLVPGRLGPLAAALDGTVPFGTLAAQYGGLRRAARAAIPTGRPDPVLESTALLMLGQDDAPAGIAWEDTTGEYVSYVARRAAGGR